MFQNTRIKRFLMITGVVMGVYLMFRYLLPLMAPFVFSYAIFCVLRPISRWLKKRTQLPERVTGVVLIIFMLGAMTLVVYTAGQYVLQNIYRWLYNGGWSGDKLISMGQEVCGYADRWLGYSSGRTWEMVLTLVRQWQEASNERIYAWIADGTGILVRGIIRAGLVLLIGFVGAVILMRQQYALLNDIKENYFYKEINMIFGRVSEVTGCFVKTQVVIITVMAGICIAGLFLMRLGHPVAAGIGIAALDAFPILGSGMILVPWSVIQLMRGSILKAAGLLVLYIVTVCVREMLEPKLMGSKLNIHPFYMLMATVIGAQLFGFWGIFTGPLGLVIIREIIENCL